MINHEQLTTFLQDLTALSRQHGLILGSYGFVLAVHEVNDESRSQDGEYVYNDEDGGFLWQVKR